MNGICKEIYNAAQHLKNSNTKINEAEYISNCALHILKMINSQRGPNDKSIDTLMLELEEKELQTKLQHFGNSFITESENLFEQDEKFYSKSKSNEESVIVRDHIKHESNLKNLNKQFRYNNAIQNTSRDKNANRKEENKTTAATSNRKHHFEENARSNNNNE